MQRLMGASDLVYIGATGKGKRTLQDRLKDHLRLRRDMKDLGCRLDRVVQHVGPLEVAWIVCENRVDAQWKERELIAKYADDHIEIPPLNRQESGKQVSDALRSLPAKTPEERERIASSVWALKRARQEDEGQT